jgi:hypothetical protein
MISTIYGNTFLRQDADTPTTERAPSGPVRYSKLGTWLDLDTFNRIDDAIAKGYGEMKWYRIQRIIEDNEGQLPALEEPYTPRWGGQRKGHRATLYEWNGRPYTVGELSTMLGVPKPTFFKKLRQGRTIGEIVAQHRKFGHAVKKRLGAQHRPYTPLARTVDELMKKCAAAGSIK